MSVAIIDYGMCNLGSVRRAFEECGADVKVIDQPRDLDSADHIVLPGVGAFTKGMANLHSQGWVEALNQNALKERKPLLGICLGMQLLAEIGLEGGETKGLGFIPGRVERFISTSPEIRIPHVGWNEIHFESSPLFKGLAPGTDFYFVHSYHFVIKNAANKLSSTPYCGEFVSAVHNQNIYGVQFHPEKSQKPGFKLIQNFLSLC
ncbi:MAG: hisH [Bacteriovoracaceae bacterium]|nr:hisH [Bacteriovoracaceae bacterium]